MWHFFQASSMQDSVDKFAVSAKKKRATPVDQTFLKEIEGWRILLARNIALRNNKLERDDDIYYRQYCFIMIKLRDYNLRGTDAI